MAEILVFNKWSTSGLAVEDLGLQKYITITPKIAPKTGARYAGRKFHKSKISIIERLINKVMIPGHKAKKHFRTSESCTGKAATSFQLVKKAFIIIEQKLKKNPIQVFVKAVENAAPREEIVTIEYGGARYPKSVECAPQRRIDVALRYFVQGAIEKSFNKKTAFVTALADEIVNSFHCDPKSVAISKKLEIERQADSSR